jgi:hypothetical protein
MSTVGGEKGFKGFSAPLKISKRDLPIYILLKFLGKIAKFEGFLQNFELFSILFN